MKMGRHDWYRLAQLLALSVMGALISLCSHRHEDHYSLYNWRMRELTVADIQRLPDYLLVDARPRELYDEQRIPGALWLTESDWDGALPDVLGLWRDGIPLVIYCGGTGCSASKRVALRLLRDISDARIYVLRGGFPAWQIAHE